MRLLLFDTNTTLTDAWRDHFSDLIGTREVVVFDGNLASLLGDRTLGFDVDALVSPANSFGYMRGGIDGAYTQTFGQTLERAVQSRILESHDGELPVGKATSVQVPYPDADTRTAVRWLVVAPTMRMPASYVAGTPNVYMAAKAAFNVARRTPWLGTLACPGMGTGVGGVDPDVCAAHMRMAWTASEFSHTYIPTMAQAREEIEALQLT